MKKEKDLAEELGIERELLKDFRKEGMQGWVKDGNWVVWTKEGEHSVRNAIQKKMCIEELDEPEPEPIIREFTVTKIPLNRRLVICGDTYVMVTDNKNFMKGMKLNARPPREGRSWVLVGRCPRWRGKY